MQTHGGDEQSRESLFQALNPRHAVVARDDPEIPEPTCEIRCDDPPCEAKCVGDESNLNIPGDKWGCVLNNFFPGFQPILVIFASSHMCSTRISASQLILLGICHPFDAYCHTRQSLWSCPLPIARTCHRHCSTCLPCNFENMFGVFVQ